MKKYSINKLGIVGGNLTSALICLEASKKGIKTLLLDKTIGNVAAEFATQHILAEATKENIEKLILRVDTLMFSTSVIPTSGKYRKIEVPTYPNKEGIEMLESRVQLLNLATSLEIPVPNYYYQNNKEDVFEKLDSIHLPFTFYQIYEDKYESIDILNERDIQSFVYEVDEDAKEWLIEQINDYHKILSITVLKDQEGKVCTYPVVEEMIEDEDVNYINVPADITKAANQKITRYAKKLIKEMDTQGLFTLKFGMKKNKSIEFMHISPGITIGDIATLHYFDLSVYEQYVNMVCGIGIIEPTLLKPSTVTITKQDELPVGMKLPYHLYVVDKDTDSPIKIYIKEREQTE